jgi:hypothetical protein
LINSSAICSNIVGQHGKGLNVAAQISVETNRNKTIANNRTISQDRYMKSLLTTLANICYNYDKVVLLSGG